MTAGELRNLLRNVPDEYPVTVAAWLERRGAEPLMLVVDQGEVLRGEPGTRQVILQAGIGGLDEGRGL